MTIPKKINPDALYAVRVRRPVPVGAVRLRPGSECRVKGSVLDTIKDDVLEAVIVEVKAPGDCVIPARNAVVDARPKG